MAGQSLQDIKTRMKPPLSYYGGKQKLARDICAALYQSPNWDVRGHYIEPFFGGGAVFFAKEPQRMETINDLNDSLIHFYRVIRDPQGFERVKALLDGTLYSRSEFNRAGRILKGEEEADAALKAWAVFVRIDQSFGRQGEHWGLGFNKSVDNRHLHWPPHTFQYKKDIFFKEDYCARLRNVCIESSHALSLISRFDSEASLFYLDPPYAGTNFSYAGLKWSELELSVLLDALKTLKGRFILSGFPHPLIDAAAAECGWQIARKRCAYCMQTTAPAKKAGKVEILASNYPFTLEGWQIDGQEEPQAELGV